MRQIGILPKRHLFRVILLHDPVDRVRAEFTGQELIEKNDETLAHVALVKISSAIQRLGFVILLRAPVPLIRARRAPMIDLERRRILT